MVDSRAKLIALAASAPLALFACGGGAQVQPARESCDEQIILGLAAGLARTDELVSDIARVAAVDLVYLRSVSRTLHVFALSAPGQDADCREALGRLRRDSRVHSVEIDVRRTHTRTSQ